MGARGGEHTAIQFALGPGFGRQGGERVGQRILRLAADPGRSVAICSAVCPWRPVEYSATAGGWQQVLQAQTAQNTETLLEVCAPLLRSTRARARDLADPDGSTEESAPPAMAMSTVPAMMDSVTVATAWKRWRRRA